MGRCSSGRGVRLRETELEQVGTKLRSMMPWIAKQKLVDRGKN